MIISDAHKFGLWQPVYPPDDDRVFNPSWWEGLRGHAEREADRPLGDILETEVVAHQLTDPETGREFTQHILRVIFDANA